MSPIRPSQAADITTANSLTILVLDGVPNTVQDGLLDAVSDGVSDEVLDGKMPCDFAP
jgi:hypothetical protein